MKFMKASGGFGIELMMILGNCILNEACITADWIRSTLVLFLKVML